MDARSPARVLVLGSHGMLGHVLVHHLRATNDCKVWGASRSSDAELHFDAAEREGPGRLLEQHGPFDVIMNCIAILQGAIDETNPASIGQAEEINGVFPRRLARAAAEKGVRVVHISTDAVFAPDAGRCVESTPVSPVGTYSRSKHQGEVEAAHVLNLRCSLVGPDLRNGRGLLEWLRTREAGESVTGFTDQQWVGCTTLQLAVLCRSLIAPECFAAVSAEGSVHHFCPCPPVSKHQLVAGLVKAFNLPVRVAARASGHPVSRRLDTERHALAALYRPTPLADALAALASFASVGPGTAA